MAVVARHGKVNENPVDLSLDMSVRCARASRDVDGSNLLACSYVCSYRRKRGKNRNVVEPRESLVRVTLDFNKVSGRVLPCTLRDRARIVWLSLDKICNRAGLRRVYGRANLYAWRNCILGLMSLARGLVDNTVIRDANSAARKWSVGVRVLTGSCDVGGCEGLFLGEWAV